MVVATNVAGNLLLAFGLKQEQYAVAALGVLLLIVWTLSRMTLLSWADLSYVLPVTALGYVLVAVAGKVFLAEQITMQRWWGAALITLGIALAGSTKPKTTGGGA